ncbi:MAG: CPBP family intramembrane glutamic endopeptidase [Chloroflexota bacterium]
MVIQSTDTQPNDAAENNSKNSIPRLRQLISQGRLTRFWPLLIIFIRFPLIMLGNLIVYGAIITFTDRANPWEYALMWGNVHTSLIADAITIALVVWLIRREGLSLADLINWRPGQLWRESLNGLGLTVILYLTLFIGGMAGAFIAFGSDAFAFDSSAFADLTRADLPPLWYYLWSFIILPITVAVAEELAYRGYAQPRLEALIGGKWTAVFIVAFGFGIQHIAFSLTDWQSALARFIGTFIAGLVFGIIYLRQRRLFLLIIAHWLVDVIGLGLFPMMFYLSL